MIAGDLAKFLLCMIILMIVFEVPELGTHLCERNASFREFWFKNRYELYDMFVPTTLLIALCWAYKIHASLLLIICIFAICYGLSEILWSRLLPCWQGETIIGFIIFTSGLYFYLDNTGINPLLVELAEVIINYCTVAKNFVAAIF